jgi:hypothetical protein
LPAVTKNQVAAGGHEEHPQPEAGAAFEEMAAGSDS